MRVKLKVVRGAPLVPKNLRVKLKVVALTTLSFTLKFLGTTGPQELEGKT